MNADAVVLDNTAEAFTSFYETIAKGFHVPIAFFNFVLKLLILLWDIIVTLIDFVACIGNCVSKFRTLFIFAGSLMMKTANLVIYVCGFAINSASLIIYPIDFVIQNASLVFPLVITSLWELAKLFYRLTSYLVICLKSECPDFRPFETFTKEACLGLAIPIVLYFSAEYVISRNVLNLSLLVTVRNFQYVSHRTNEMFFKLAEWSVHKFLGFRQRLCQLFSRNQVVSDTKTSADSAGKVPDATDERQQEDIGKALMEELKREMEALLCVVCQDEKKSVVIIPCRHMCVCKPCAMILRNTDPCCPLCRGNMVDIIHIYS